MYIVLAIDAGIPDWGTAKLFKPKAKKMTYNYAKFLCVDRDIPVSDELDEDDWIKGVDINTLADKHDGEIGEPEDCVHVVWLEVI